MIRTFLTSGLVALTVGFTATGCTTLSVDKADVEEKIRTNLGPQVDGRIDTVMCPDDLTGQVGETMECAMAVQGRQVTVKVTVTSVEGSNVNFNMETV